MNLIRHNLLLQVMILMIFYDNKGCRSSGSLTIHTSSV